MKLKLYNCVKKKRSSWIDLHNKFVQTKTNACGQGLLNNYSKNTWRFGRRHQIDYHSIRVFFPGLFRRTKYYWSPGYCKWRINPQSHWTTSKEQTSSKICEVLFSFQISNFMQTPTSSQNNRHIRNLRLDCLRISKLFGFISNSYHHKKQKMRNKNRELTQRKVEGMLQISGCDILWYLITWGWTNSRRAFWMGTYLNYETLQTTSTGKVNFEAIAINHALSSKQNNSSLSFTALKWAMFWRSNGSSCGNSNDQQLLFNYDIFTFRLKTLSMEQSCNYKIISRFSLNSGVSRTSSCRYIYGDF